MDFKEGETVMGNFKGLGDWEEALVVGIAPDGTYTLEYVDEGLLEDGVPADRICKYEGADAESQAASLSNDGIGMCLEEGSAAASSSSISATAFTPVATQDPSGAEASGEAPSVVSAEEESVKAEMVLTAAQLATWSTEMLEMPPSVEKVDRYMDLFDLPQLRVQSMMSKAAQPLFPSLQAWFDAMLPALAESAPRGAVETMLRVFLAPQQSVRQGLQHVTFAVDWVRVKASFGKEPLSSSILAKMGLSQRRPQTMCLVVMLRAEKNKITHVWADLDREGLANKPGTALDDVLVSEAFERALELARKSGAVGQLDPIFNNYHNIETIG